MKVMLQRLQHTDINLLRELRNANADAFFDDTYITREMQEDWWWRYTQSSRVQFMTIWLNKVNPVGFMSVTLQTPPMWSEGNLFHVAEIGHLLLAPAYRGRGIMHAAITEVRRLYSPLTFWVAHVKPTNTASLRLFARQKFVQLDGSTTRSQINERMGTKAKTASINQRSSRRDVP